MCTGQCSNELFSGAMNLGNIESASVASNREICAGNGKLKPNTIIINKKSSLGDHILMSTRMKK